MRYSLLFLTGLLLCTLDAQSQQPEEDQLPAAQGAWARLEVNNGDSVYAMSLRPVRIYAKRNFKNFDEQRQYYLYMRAAKKVYPYAVQALAVYDQVATETKDMNKRQRRRYIRGENRELNEDFEEKMKQLSKTEGKVLIKMIERELDEPFYDVLRDLRGSVTATYWHNLGKIWGYDLKEGYIKGSDPLLDEILIDYDFGHPEWWYY